MAKGIVYILINQSLEGWVKIGYTDNNDIQQRLNTLNASTSIPLSFRVYATLLVENPREVEQRIHRLFDIINPGLHSIEKLENGRERIREFFKVSPEKAYRVFNEVAGILGVLNDLTLLLPNEKEQEEEQIARAPRQRTTFKALKIPVGSELTFFKDETVKCTTLDDNNKVLFKGEETTLSAIGKDIMGYPVSGPSIFVFEEEILWDRRLRLESTSVCDVE